MPGPPRTPTNLLRLRGSWRGKARAKSEPVARGRPRCPDWLDAEDRKAFGVVAKWLVDLGVASSADSNVISRYVVLWGRWRKTEDAIRQHGMTYCVVTASGEVFRERPEVAVAAQLAGELLRLEQNLGLTPAARAKLRCEVEPAVDDSFEKFLRGGG